MCVVKKVVEKREGFFFGSPLEPESDTADAKRIFWRNVQASKMGHGTARKHLLPKNAMVR
jgi:hypothetical protein